MAHTLPSAFRSSRPPSQIVPALADEGVYLASDSSVYRVLRMPDSFTTEAWLGRRADAASRRPTGPDVQPGLELGITYLASKLIGFDSTEKQRPC